ncbi:MAG: hypothetical protein NC930_01870 [Candidatus Omnitrophica bacterium]|nr:hypothetical protein [Candidatus Omnitrophota bacterium]
MKKILVFLVGIFIFSAASTDAKGTDYLIRFGQMEKMSSGYELSRETTVIPFRLKETGFLFGFTVQHLRGEPFTGYQIIRLPSSPKQISGQPGSGEVSQMGQSFRSNPKVRSGFWSEAIWFEEGDPLGKWKIEIYLDNVLEKIIEFTVVPDERNYGDQGLTRRSTGDDSWNQN